MKNYIKGIAIFGLALMFTSCLVDDTASTVDNDKGPNLVGFTKAAVNASVVSDGSTTVIPMTVQFTGPTASEFTGDFDVTVAVDPSSTAVEGVHYSLASKTLSLSSSKNYIANLPLTIITAGIDPPLDVNPVLTLKITEISDGSVVPNGRTSTIKITIEYLCFSDITGKYKAVTAAYWRIGSNNATASSWPAETEIIYICRNTYRVVEYFGLFGGNEFYFEVSETGVISYPATTPTGAPQSGNGQPFITCQSNPGDMTNVNCGSSNFVQRTNGVIRLHMSFGYFTPNSGSREFYQVMEKL